MATMPAPSIFRAFLAARITSNAGRQARVKRDMLTVASRAALAGLWALGLAAGPVLAAQPEPQSHAVVEALPDPNDPNHLLNAALIRLGQSPRDSEALISAGNAALALGDADAARGFLTRADRLSPGNPRVQAGLAGAMLRGNDPVAAIPLYEAADRGGALDGDRISDRGLAYDLVGDNLTAQRYYRQALAMGANDETVRRLGLSLAIAGDRRGMEVTLSPLLQKQDRASWRVRAFAFAILGREEEAVAIAKATMPGDLATGISPYLRYMRKLTPAQRRALIIADNKLAELATWKTDVLKDEFGELIAADYDLDLTAFNSEELEELGIGDRHFALSALYAQADPGAAGGGGQFWQVPECLGHWSG